MKKTLFFFIAALLISLAANTQTITVTSPNGGESWPGCTQKSITWIASGTSNYYSIDYSTNGGTNWTSIASFYNTSSGSYSWTVPNVSSTNCIVRVYDANNPNISDVSNEVFTVIGPLILTSPNGGEIWQGLTAKNISWTATGTSNNYNLEYSTNAGSTWTTIVSAYNTTSGTYPWTVPNTPSANSLVRITDYSNACMTDKSNNLFTISPALPTVTAPNGGESWIAGTSRTITWNSATYTSTNVAIEYSVDSGATWLSVLSTTPNDGSQTWVMPNNPSTKALVKISEVGNPAAFDISDAVFTIAPYITLTSPNGGENYLGCEIKTISWTAGNTSGQYTIQYSTDNGTSWNTIVQTYATSATNCTYSWTVNNVTSANCMIKVFDLFDASKSDRSDGSFTITGTNNVVLNSPNGGEQWKVGYSNPIQYVMSGPTTAVKISYSTDNGANWTQITSNTSNVNYNWSVPNTPSTSALIKVEDRLNSCNYDQSNAVFTIVPHITITSPNGGEYLYGCNSSDITWIAGGTSGIYKIEYSTDNGTTWSSIVNNYSTSAISCTYTWSVLPNVNSNNSLIRITDAANASKTDVSDANFTLAASSNIVLLAPNGGEQWKAITSASSASGSYNMSNAPVTTSSGYFYDSGGSSGYYSSYESYTKTFTPAIPGSMLKFEFTTFNTYTSSDRLYIYNGPNTSSPLLGSYYSSYGPSTVVASNPTGQLTFVWTSSSYGYTGWAATISVTNPNPTNIIWASNNVSNYYDIYYSTNNGTNWNLISASYYTTSNSYNWTIPNTPSANCLVRVEDANNTCKKDLSNANFTIIAATPFLLTPNGAEGWFAGTSRTITWASASYLTSNVVLDYSTNNGASWINISPSAPNNGSYTWTVPNTPSTNCLVRVSEVGNPVQRDSSDAVFSILPYITVTAPNGGNILEGCNSYVIRWTTGGTSGSFNIDYTSDNGVTWNNLTTAYATSSTNATYTWTTMPNISLPNCKIRVRDAADANKSDMSDSTFSLTQTSNVVVVTPNGGETLQGWGNYNIQYAVSGSTSYVNLSYSINGGTTWNSIVSTTSGGSYTWTLPNTPSINCLIKAEDYNNSCKTDQSNAAFTIIPAPRQLTAPNGGEVWLAGKTQSITWSSGSFLSTYVKLDYTIDSGANWLPIVASITNNGSYNWIIPNNPSERALVRISEVGNPSAFDISDAKFTLAPYITLTSPNGNENYLGCEIKTISWTAGNTSGQYTIQYSTDNGTSWNTIVQTYATSATNCTYSWTVNNVTSANCMIKVFDLFDASKSDRSDGSFTITGTNNVVLNSPNGGEQWKVGYSNPIQYVMSGPTTAVKISYSTDNGANWTQITSNTSNVNYNWSVPNTPSTSALIKVEDRLNSCNYDQSNAVFTIVPHITITSPNGGEYLYGCNSSDITWIAGGTSGIYKIEYSTDNGTTWSSIVNNYSTSAISCTYTWSVLPNVNSNNSLIRITDAANASKTDVSDANFTLAASSNIVLLAPNGGEQWKAITSASSASGSYNMSNAPVTTSSGYFYDSGGSSGYYSSYESYTKTFTPAIPGSMLKFEFTTFNTYTSSDRLYIYNGPNTSSPLLGSYYSSYGPSTVVASNPTGQLTFVWTSSSYGYTGWAATISVTNPNPTNIIWASNNVSNYYDIYYSTNNGTNWNLISASYYTTSNSYNWTIPNTPSANCLVRVEDANNTCKKDLSNANFTIIAATPFLLTPNGAEGWFAGTSRTITWASASYLTSNVVLDYSTNNGASWINISPSAPNNGSYTWTVPNTPSTNCLVRVSEVGNPVQRDSSDAVFSILPYITVTAPNGGNILEGCNSYVIRWTTGGTSGSFNIDYTSDNGVTWNNLTTAYATSSTNATYTWTTMPNISLPNCKIRVRDAADANKSDMSDSTFSLTQTSNVVVVTPNGGETLQGWGNYNIQYAVSGSTSYVNLSYSINGGTTWNSIVSTTSGGSYTWTLPNTPSINCLIKAEDYNNSCKTDQSNAAFTIIPAPRQLTAPNGGENWIAGTSRSITWTSGSFLSNYVKIEYSVDSGASWITVVASVTNNGSYSWTTPNTPSTLCLLKISETTNSSNFDVSDATFTISPFITVTYPNGNENLLGCEIKNITWTAGATSQYYLIEYSTDNGSTWSTIASNYNTSATNCTYSWTVNNAVSSMNCKIRVTDMFTPLKTDISDNAFSITQVTNAILLTPNGGESWKVGTTQQIKYTTGGPTTAVKLFYSTDNGNTWNTITSNTSGGIYNWSVPNAPSTTCLVKVEDKNIACNADQSNAVFTIEPHITITAPNGGEVLYGCRSNDISWFGGGTSNYYKIEYSSNGGTTWNTIVANYYSTSISNTYNWGVIPNLNSSNSLIRISDASNAAKFDVSDAFFTITNTTDLILFTPNGNEQWQSTVGATSNSGTYLMNSNTPVTTSSGYFYDSGNSSGNYGYNENYTKTFTPEIPGNMLKFEFSSFSTYNSNDILYIYNGPNTTSPLIGTYYSSYTPGTVTASNPTGQLTFRWTSDGSSVYSGWSAVISSVSSTPNLITWATSNTSQYYNIYYSTNTGATWNNIVSSYYTSGTSYLWNIPNTPSANCLVKIEDANNTCKYDISDSKFTIIAAKPTIISPNGTETWYSLENRDITWANATFLSANVVIEYSLDSGFTWNSIVAVTPNDGSHTWTVPSFNKQYFNCLIRVSEYGNTTVNDISNALFTLTPPILITSPNGDNGVSSWRGCTQSTITWKAGTSTYYNIDYSINNGTTWTSVVNNYYNSSANVTYSWSIPNTPSNQCLVRVTDYNSSIKTDISDSTFTISPTITLLQPNYGGVIQAGSVYNIKWTADGTSNFYDIEYSTNGGNTWNSIAYNHQSTTGIYAWTVPTTLSSNCMVRVTDNVSSCKTDKSDYVFTISSAPASITLTSPNGGESINSCSPYNITWAATGTSQNYMIEYSTNGGTSWNTIILNHNTSSGIYVWNVPNINANNCLIRVKDVVNTALSDASDAAFSIAQTVTANITASGSTTFCSGGSVTLTSNSSSGNNWSPGGLSTQSIVVTTPGTYTLTVNNGSGCSATSAPKTIIVNQLPTLPVITANGSTNICAGNTVILSSSYASGNTWLPNGQTTKDIGVNNSGSYTVKYTDVNGCSSVSAPVDVTVNPLSAAPTITANSPITFCAGDSVTLTSSAITGNIWSPGNQTSQSIIIYNSGSYSVSVGNGCSAPSLPVVVTVNPSPGNPVITPSGSTTFCEGGNVILTSSYASGNQWLPNGQSSQSINITTSGTYRVKIIGGNGCPAYSLSLQVTVNQIPQAPTAYSNSPVPLNGTLILTADSISGASFAWTGPNNFTSSSRIANIPYATSLLNGNYLVKASISGCEGPSSSVNVSVANATAQVNLSGMVNSENNDPIKTVSLNLSGIEGNQNFVTSSNGNYNFNVTASNTYTITPSKNNDSVPDNGISTLDIILMQRHILNIDSLDSPYKMIAADVNGSGNVTTMDIILTRRMILHTSNFFPGNKLWSFVSSDYNFVNPNNPFPFSENKVVTNATQLNNLDFIGIKLGDVNNSWNNTVSKSSVGEISFYTEGQNVSMGDIITVPVKVKDFQNVSGYQFTLNWDASAFELQNVNNAALENFYGNQQIANGKLSVMWSSEIQNGITLNDDSVVFKLTFKVIGNSNPNQTFVFNSTITKSEGYNNQLQALVINGYTSNDFIIGSSVGITEKPELEFKLLQNVPNPFNEQTEICFILPTDEYVTFMFYNTLGEMVNSISGNYSSGKHKIIWKGNTNNNKALSNGTYYLQMQAGKYAGFRKIIILR